MKPAPPLFYYRTIKQIKEYRKQPARKKLLWLEETARFFNKIKNIAKKNQQR